MTNYMSSIISLFNLSTIYLSDMQTTIKERLYIALSEFSVDRADLWLFEQQRNAYIPKAYIFIGVVNNDDLPNIYQPETSSLFDNRQATTVVIVRNIAADNTLEVDFEEFLFILKLQLILLIALRVNGKNRGFIFLGNSSDVFHWSGHAVLTCQLLSQLLIPALIISDDNDLKKTLNIKNKS